ncbi:hypothetical protein [Salmonella enterica]|uniref:hypothetical protein n=1 Tax=Salmonella enterica TaxID=28901 RepID=UPI00193D36D7|nr:hypothetical protein [Salmonella enterica]EEN5589312.1 hypothetical protein [Salmonella enterica subsp. enterica serovar Mountpleasant]
MNKHQIHVRLVERHSSFRKFALSSGYNPRTVTQAVNRWAGSHDFPRGRLTYKILRDLSEVIGMEVIPGILRGGE